MPSLRNCDAVTGSQPKRFRPLKLEYQSERKGLLRPVRHRHMLEASMDASLVIPSVLVFATPKHQRRNIFHHIYSDPCPAPVSKVPFGISVQFRKLCKLTPKTVRWVNAVLGIMLHHPKTTPWKNEQIQPQIEYATCPIGQIGLCFRKSCSRVAWHLPLYHAGKVASWIPMARFWFNWFLWSCCTEQCCEQPMFAETWLPGFCV